MKARRTFLSLASVAVLLVTGGVLLTGSGTVRGVLDTDGNPLRDCLLEPEYQGPFPASTTDEGILTGDDGSFVFDVPAGRNAVSALCGVESSAVESLLLMRGRERTVRLVVRR